MMMLYDLMARLHTGFLEVDIPKPEAPDSGDIIDKGNDGAAWLAGRSGAFWTIVLVLVLATIITAALKRSFVKGILLGAVILAIAIAMAS